MIKAEIDVNMVELEEVSSFIYLEATLSKDGSITTAIHIMLQQKQVPSFYMYGHQTSI